MKRFQESHRDTRPLLTPSAISRGMTSGEGGVWAWVVIPTRSTDELGSAALFDLTTRGAADLRQALPKGVEFQIKIQWGVYSGAEHVQQQSAHWLGDPPPAAALHISLQGDRIDQNAFPRRQVLLGVRLDEAGARAATAQKLLGGADPIKTAKQSMDTVAKRASAWIERMARSSFRARAATVQELAWALRRDLRRTVDWLPPGPMAGPGETARLRAGEVRIFDDHLTIKTDKGIRYLRCLTPTVTGFPAEDLALPGGEWLRNLLMRDDEFVGYPVEVSIRGRNLAPTDSMKQMSEALSLLKEQGREASRGLAEETPDELELARAVLRTRMSEVSRGVTSMVEDMPIWIVEADSLDELERRSTQVIDFYAGMQITLWTGNHLQGDLWRSTVVGDRSRIEDFVQLRPMSTLVGGWFHGGSALGQEDGPYVAANIGSTPGPLKLRITDAALDGDPVTSVFLGSSGTGKSTAVMLLCLAEAAYGSWVLLVDLKGDLHGAPVVARQFGIPTYEVSASNAASGSMCPFRYISDPQAAAQICLDLLLLMLRKSLADGSEAVLRRITNHVATWPEQATRSTAAVIDLLANSERPEERILGEELLELAKDPLVLPVAGPADPDALTLPTRPGLVYMRLDAMAWPERDALREDWTPANRMTMMLTRATFAYSTYMSGRVKGTPKVIALPELHLLTRYDVGRSMIKSTALMGRALDTSLLLDTQACAELRLIEGLEDQVTLVAAFRVRSVEEAKAQAAFLALPADQEVINRQQRWGKGQSEVRDRWDQVAPVQWDYMHTAIAEALSTTQKRDPYVDSQETDDVA